MADKTSILRCLIRIDRITCWVLLLALVLLIMSGFTMTGGYGFNRLFGIEGATSVHTGLCELVIALLAYHSGVRGYLELKRLGILK
jgi:cytochrome b subunit of formate dehydrogenase